MVFSRFANQQRASGRTANQHRGGRNRRRRRRIRSGAKSDGNVVVEKPSSQPQTPATTAKEHETSSVATTANSSSNTPFASAASLAPYGHGAAVAIVAVDTFSSDSDSSSSDGSSEEDEEVHQQEGATKISPPSMPPTGAEKGSAPDDDSRCAPHTRIRIGSSADEDSASIDDPFYTVRQCQLVSAWFQRRGQVVAAETAASNEQNNNISVADGAASLLNPLTGILEQQQQQQQSIFDVDVGEEDNDSENPNNERATADRRHVGWFSDGDTNEERTAADRSTPGRLRLTYRYSGPSIDRPEFRSSAVSVCTNDAVVVSGTAPMTTTQEDRASIISAATSDMTPVVCNKSIISSILIHEGDDEDGVHEELRRRKKRFYADRSCWKDLFNFRTYPGKVAFLLMVIFVLAIAIILGSSLAGRDGSDEQSSNSGQEQPQQDEAVVENRGKGASVGDSEPTKPPVPEDFDAIVSTRPTPAPTLMNAETATPAVRTFKPGDSTTTSPPVPADDASASPAPSAPPSIITNTPTLPPTWAPTLPFESLKFSPVGDVIRGDGRAGAAVTEPVSEGDPTGKGKNKYEDEPLYESSRSDAFGSSVVLSKDGRFMAVGAREADGVSSSDNSADVVANRAGQVTIYELTEAYDESYSWKIRATLPGKEIQGNFGASVAINANGSIVAVGEPGRGDGGNRTGRVIAYRSIGEHPDGGNIDGNNSYRQVGQILLGASPMSYFGASISLSDDGRRLAVGAPATRGEKGQEGAVQVYELTDDDAEWRPMGGALTGTKEHDWLGSAVDLSEGMSVVATGCNALL